jgi:Phospholipase_D-nuclease N-terminal
VKRKSSRVAAGRGDNRGLPPPDGRLCSLCQQNSPFASPAAASPRGGDAPTRLATQAELSEGGLPGSPQARKGAEMSSYPLLNVFLTMMWFFLWVLWISMVFWVLIDIFRSPDLSGWVKAGWVLLTVLLPFVGVLIYLIARGSTMHEHQDRRDRNEIYLPSDRAIPDDGQASEISRLAALRDRSVITEAEFQQGKTKVLS